MIVQEDVTNITVAENCVTKVGFSLEGWKSFFIETGMSYQIQILLALSWTNFTETYLYQMLFLRMFILEG